MDTATSQVVLAVGASDGQPVRVVAWAAGHRHGELLVPSIERLLAEANVRRSGLGGIVVGTGPGAFTGLRVGLATAKALAHALRCPIAGVGTAAVLIAAAAEADRLDPDRVVLLLPAGPSDRVIVRRSERPRRLSSDDPIGAADDEAVVAVDLDGRAEPEALARGARARERLGAQLLALGAGRLAAGGDDLAELVPEYVTLPRGVTASGGEVAWSHDRR